MIPNSTFFFPLAMEISISFQIYLPKVSKINYVGDNVCMDYKLFIFSFAQTLDKLTAV